MAPFPAKKKVSARFPFYSGLFHTTSVRWEPENKALEYDEYVRASIFIQGVTLGEGALWV